MQRFNLMIGCDDELGLNFALVRLVRETNDGRLGDVHVMWHADEILHFAALLKIGFHVLVLNILMYPGRGQSGFDLEVASLSFVRRLRDITHAPILALFALPDSPDYSNKVIEAGASLFACAPFVTNEVQEAVRKLLSATPWAE
ncbi:MAG: hypothetical protein IT364_21175 [Candidatus Hydrogenedentes bacterium]|nr:hypothetical protein [Candidatus Hydrogenedentota bacterium]